MFLKNLIKFKFKQILYQSIGIKNFKLVLFFTVKKFGRARDHRVKIPVKLKPCGKGRDLWKKTLDAK